MRKALGIPCAAGSIGAAFQVPNGPAERRLRQGAALGLEQAAAYSVSAAYSVVKASKPQRLIITCPMGDTPEGLDIAGVAIGQR